jgi:hypothetical protein
VVPTRVSAAHAHHVRQNVLALGVHVTRIIASVTCSLLVAAVVTCVGCASATSPSPDGDLASVGQSVSVGPLEYRLDATFTPTPGSSRRERVDLSVRFANTTEETATLYPETPDVSVQGEAGDVAMAGGDGESKGWSMMPGTYSEESTAALAPGGYFVMRRTFLVDQNDDLLTATVDAQGSGGVTWKLR